MILRIITVLSSDSLPSLLLSICMQNYQRGLKSTVYCTEVPAKAVTDPKDPRIQKTKQQMQKA